MRSQVLLPMRSRWTAQQATSHQIIDGLLIRLVLGLSPFTLAPLAAAPFDTVRWFRVVFAAIWVAPAITATSLDTFCRIRDSVCLSSGHNPILNITTGHHETWRTTCRSRHRRHHQGPGPVKVTAESGFATRPSL